MSGPVLGADGSAKKPAEADSGSTSAPPSASAPITTGSLYDFHMRNLKNIFFAWVS